MKNAIALAISALFATAAFAGGAPLTAGASGAVGVSANVGGSSSATLSGGSSQSGAQSLQSAQVAVTSGTIIPGGNINGAQQATIGAVGSTASQGFAYNLSTGAASGSASMSGWAQQQASGNAGTQTVGNPAQAAVPGTPPTGIFVPGWGCIAFCTPGTPGSPAVAQSATYIPAGTASGNEWSNTTQSINAGANQGEAVGSVSGGNFGADVGFTTNSQAISVPAPGNTVTTQDGPGIQLTAGAIGGTYSQTSTTNGVYQSGTSINFGGNSNFVPTAVNSATGSFGATSSIDGAVTSGAPANVQSPL